MLDTAIVGGGLCGLALARELHEQGRPFAVFEARSRLGGRILCAPAANGTTRVDLGPTWFWPQSQPLMTKLVAELGLSSFEQHDRGIVLALTDPDKPAETTQTEGVHDGARRLAGGMVSLIDAIAERLPAECLHPGHVLSTVVRHENHVELRFLRDDAVVTVQAHRAVLAAPPRLLAERVRFEPALDEKLHAAMLATPTWMAAQAKAIILYEQAAWRTAGQSGNAFVRHEQVVLKEIFDACDAAGTVAALGGFVALPPAVRRSFRAGLPMLMSSQMTQVFGPRLEEREQVFQDWASELHTCSSRDLTDFSIDAAHPDYGNPVLRHPVWGRRLHFGGSETAGHGGGHLEGALEAAHRIQHELATLDAEQGHAASSDIALVRAVSGERGQSPAISSNAASVAQFRGWVQAQQQPAFESYRQRINHSLATHQREQLTQRAMLATMEQVFGDALAQLDTLPFDTTDVGVERGRSALTPQVQAAFEGFIRNLLDEVVAFNGTSCALSNFPDEHHLSREYEQTTLRDIAAAWREFSLSANSLLLGKGIAAPLRPEYTHSPRGIAS